MIQFILRKLLFLFPTVFVVMVTAFFLSKLVPGDRAESMLILQGVQPEASNYNREYQKIYLNEGLDKPLFYFSVLPHFYHDNVHSILDIQDKYLTQKWQSEKYHNNKIIEVLNERRILISNLEKDTSKKFTHVLKNLRFEDDVNHLIHWFDTLQLFPIAFKDDVMAFRSALSSMEVTKVTWYYPKFVWHGSGNQFHHWAISVFKGDLGQSIKDGRQVSHKISKAIRWTLLLAILSMSIALMISIPTGLYSGYYSNTWIAKGTNFFWLLLYSIPVFWLASILILYATSDRYGTWLNIFPAPGIWYVPDDQSIWKTIIQNSQQLVLPVICMVANDIAQISTIIRNNTEEQKSKTYILMARAKGLTEANILIKHILPNVLLPLITIAGGRLASGLAGALIIEVIFNIPGMGRLMYDSILSNDWNVVFGILIVLSVVTILFLTITEILYAWANPKIHQKMQIS
jgi:peptide/nickel transport system permease protein